MDIVASFQTSYYISGIAPFGDSLAILAYIPGEEDGEKDFSSTAPPRQVFFLNLYLSTFKCLMLHEFLVNCYLSLNSRSLIKLSMLFQDVGILLFLGSFES